MEGDAPLRCVMCGTRHGTSCGFLRADDELMLSKIARLDAAQVLINSAKVKCSAVKVSNQEYLILLHYQYKQVLL